MFQSPIGGVSFILNLLIILVTLSMRVFKKGYNKEYLITQEHIKRLENGRIGLAVSRFFVYGFPVMIFCFLSFVSVSMIQRLYADENRITLFDAVYWSSSHAQNGVEIAKNEHYLSSFVTSLESAKKVLTRGDDRVANPPLSRESNQAVVFRSSLDTASVFSSTTNDQNSESKLASKRDSNEESSVRILLPLGRDLDSLKEFLDINGVRSSFKERRMMAHFLGMDDYQGTKIQNIELLNLLKELTTESKN